MKDWTEEMATRSENERRQELAQWVETELGGRPALALTLTVRPWLAASWRRRFEQMKKAPITLKRAMKVFVATNDTAKGARTAPTRTALALEARQLMTRLNNKLGGPYRSGDLVLRRVFVIEGDGYVKHLHLHGLVEIPFGYGAADFAALVEACWRGSLWAGMRNRIDLVDSVQAWVHYITKEGLEHLDIRTLYV